MYSVFLVPSTDHATNHESLPLSARKLPIPSQGEANSRPEHHSTGNDLEGTSEMAHCWMHFILVVQG